MQQPSHMYVGGFRKNLEKYYIPELSTILKFDFLGKNGSFIQNNKKLFKFKVQNRRFESKNGSSIDFIGNDGSSFIDFIVKNGSFLDFIGENGNLIGYSGYYYSTYGEYDRFNNFMSKIRTFVDFIGIECGMWDVHFIDKNGRKMKFHVIIKRNSYDLCDGDSTSEHFFNDDIKVHKNQKKWCTKNNSTSATKHIESIRKIRGIRVHQHCLKNEYNSHCDYIILKFDPNTLSWTQMGEMFYARYDHGISVVNAEDVEQFCVSKT